MSHLHIDIHTIAVIKADETYENLSTAFKDIFNDINYYIKHPQMKIGERFYNLVFFLTADYKVYS